MYVCLLLPKLNYINTLIKSRQVDMSFGRVTKIACTIQNCNFVSQYNRSTSSTWMPLLLKPATLWRSNVLFGTFIPQYSCHYIHTCVEVLHYSNKTFGRP